MLKLVNIFAGYGGGDILKGVDLEVEQGSLTCLVGPNGAGKSTVLRVISGLLSPRRGAITFNGRSIGGLSAPHILKMGIAQIPQEHSLFRDLTVEENVRLGGYLLREKGQIKRRLAQIEERFPIVKERAKERARSLSGGQQRLMESGRVRMQGPAGRVREDPEMGHLFFGGTLSGA